MLKREWVAENNEKLPHLFIPSKTATWVPEFAVEDLPLSRSAALLTEFEVNDLPLGRIHMMMIGFKNDIQLILVYDAKGRILIQNINVCKVLHLFMGWTARVQSQVSEGWRFLFTRLCPDWSWGPLSLL